MNITTIRTNIDTILGGVSGIRAHFPRHPDTISTTPATAVMMPRAKRIEPSSRRITWLDVPFRLYVGRTADEARNAKLLDDLIESIISAFETVAYSSLSGAVTLAFVREYAEAFYEIGGEAYQAVDFILDVEVKTVTYSS